MNRCECGYLAKSGAGLAAHRRMKHSVQGGANRRALEKTFVALSFAGQLTDSDAALLQMLRSMADELDQGGSPAQLWKVYGDALSTLLEKENDFDDGLAAALEEIRGAGEVGHPPEIGS